MNTVRLHNIIMHTTALGPGKRIAIWFQGCNRRCPGCMSPKSRPLQGGRLADIEKLIDAICETNDVEGITISGGEPFLQLEALYVILKAVKSRTDLGVIIYTGNTIEELKQMHDEHVDEIISSLADIIIDGEYVDSLNDGSSLRGSSNQRVNYITDRYFPYKELYEGKKRDAEVFISEGEAFFVGVPDKDTLEVWKKTTDNH